MIFNFSVSCHSIGLLLWGMLVYEPVSHKILPYSICSHLAQLFVANLYNNVVLASYT